MNQITESPIDAALQEELTSLMWKASDVILKVYHSGELDTKIKGDESPVTQADLAAHHVLVNGLSQLTPNIPLVSEQDPSSLQIPESYQRYWLVDPLDGTKELITRNDVHLQRRADQRTSNNLWICKRTGSWPPLSWWEQPWSLSSQPSRSKNSDSMSSTEHSNPSHCKQKPPQS